MQPNLKFQIFRLVRSQFEHCLPSERTIKGWMESLDGKPGFSLEVLEHLKQINSQSQIYASLSLDEMAIKTGNFFDGKQFRGQVDLGIDEEINNDINSNIKLAHQALVFFLVALNCHWKISVGYIFISAMSAVERLKIIQKCLQKIEETGVIVTNITFDAPSVNISLLQKLGGSISPNNIQPRTSFEKYPRFILLDNAHMLKERLFK